MRASMPMEVQRVGNVSFGSMRELLSLFVILVGFVVVIVADAAADDADAVILDTVIRRIEHQWNR